MKSLQEVLDDKRILISDGAWGTQLSQRGLQPGETPELWNLDRPEEVRAIAQAYVDAGADIILTNSFGGNRFKLEKSGLADRLAEINIQAARLSKEAAADRSFVFASVGPTGEFMEPLGLVTEDEMTACFAEQIQALVEGGADGIVVETMTDLNEALAALRAARQIGDMPVAVSMTFDHGPGGFATMMGVRPDRAAAELEAAGASFVGSNCGQGIRNMIEVARLMRSATKLPLWVKSNAGMPQLVGGQTIFKETPEAMAASFKELAEAGGGVIGGCCGTTPDHIRLFVAERDRLNG